MSEKKRVRRPLLERAIDAVESAIEFLSLVEDRSGKPCPPITEAALEYLRKFKPEDLETKKPGPFPAGTAVKLNEKGTTKYELTDVERHTMVIASHDPVARGYTVTTEERSFFVSARHLEARAE
jgi:hypothetical protein